MALIGWHHNFDAVRILLGLGLLGTLFIGSINFELVVSIPNSLCAG